MFFKNKVFSVATTRTVTVVLSTLQKKIKMLTSLIEEERKAAEVRKKTGKIEVEDVYNECLHNLRNYHKDTCTFFTGIIESAKRISPEKLEEVKKYFQEYKKLCNDRKVELMKLKDKTPKSVNSNKDKLKLFEQAIHAVYSTFVSNTEFKIEKIKDIVENCRTGEPSESSDVAKREKERVKLAKAESSKIQTAINKQEGLLKKLKGKFKKSSSQEKDKLRGQIIEKVTFIEGLKDRKGQFDLFIEGQKARNSQMMQMENLQKNMSTQAELIEKSLDGLKKEYNFTIAPIQEFQDRLENNTHEIVVYDPYKNEKDCDHIKAIREKVKELKKSVTHSAKSEIVAEKMFINESTQNLFEISQGQEKTLLKMLENASKLIEKPEPYSSPNTQNFRYASIILHDVQQMWIAFITNRRSGLPAPPSRPPDQKKILSSGLQSIEGKVRDLLAMSINVTAVDKQIKQIRNAVEKELDSNFDIDKGPFDELFKQLTDLEKKLDELAENSEPNLSKNDKEAKKSAKENANKLNKKLLDLYETKEIESSEAEKIPPNQLLIIEEDNETHYYQILNKTGIGGQEVTQRKNKEVPRELIDKLKFHSDTLAMMSELTVSGCEEMINQFKEEFDRELANLEKIEGNAKVYKKIEKNPQ